MEIEQSVLENLPINQRQKVCHQIRQQQIKNYLDFQRTELAKGKKDTPGQKKKNKKGNSVKFSQNYMLQDAVENFNDREVLSLLKSGADSRFATGNGTTLLHKCCAEDNASIAEILISQGVDVNCRDDDLWAPLHTACSCESLEVMQLLLKNKADATLLDVDGYFPHEHAPEGSEARHLMEKHLSQLGMDQTKLKELRLDSPRQMLNEIKNLLASGVDMNALNSNGVSLLHISSANGYKQVMKVLLQNFKTDVNVMDIRGWTPLHVAAKFDQVKAAKLLLKHKANPNAVDGFGLKPSAITNSDEIRGLLLKAEQRVTKGEVKIEQSGDEEDAVKGAEQKKNMQIIRVNSKTMKNKKGSFGKKDKLMEAMMMYTTLQDDRGDHNYDTIKEEEKAEEDYVSAIWKAASSEQGDLPFCMENDNLANVGDIKEENILTEIQKRYSKSQIYTMVCDIVIAVNPFKDLPYYGKMISMKYHNGEAPYQLPPHIYISAESAYQNLLHAKKSQCCVISGESGSGKTESCKFIVQHLLRIAGSDETNLNSKINKMNPLLEAFGNAKTVMNDNSSRFAKFMELFFTSNGKVLGARMLEYLLEKSRIIYQGKGECNFHIFYWMMSGLSPEEFNVYSLRKDGKHRYLQPRGGADVTQQFNKDNNAKFWEVKECFKFIGFSQDDIQNILQVLSIVLHLGDISFHGVGNNDAAQVSNPVNLQTVADMLEVSADELGSALVAEYTVTRGEQIKKERTLQQAEDCRDALAKTLYGHLFSWIVNGMNQLLQPEEESDCLQIGLLDIFGFENFPRNSFEQLCINLANEQLHLFTNDHVFHKEQQECLLEGVPLVKIDLTSNQNVLDLFLERHTGVLDILDEESTFPKATDKSLAAKLHKIPGKKYPTLYKTPRDEGPTFTVVHYAGSVTYELVGFLDKNRDTLPNAVLCTMKASNKLLIKEFFQSKITRTGSLAPSARQQRMSRHTTKKAASPFEFFNKLRGGKQEEMKPKAASHRKGPSTAAHYFQNSLTELVNKIQSAEPHFIRCIKPNTSKAAMLFDSQYILSQLRYTGVADIVQIRKFGYPLRLTFHEFQTRYKILSICALPQFCPMTDIEKCRQVLQKYKITDYKVGRTKLFFSHWHVLELEKLTTELEKKVITAQSVVRGFLYRHRCKTLMETHSQQKEIIASFLCQVEINSQKVEKWMIDGVQVDKEKYDLTLKQKEIAEITKSLESLDDLLNTYEEILTEDFRAEQTANYKADEYENTPSQAKNHEDGNEYDDAVSTWTIPGQGKLCEIIFEMSN
ncbi:hypothetical protein CHS0354_021430 [Potamilus streckersoni]|uniref:Myosin motor domain-containing protein n=1 Tax=Potamilus streckersoni TaxID=2493646 RepID=A0AAE0S1X1_9BIVA|nr:hypothetical protein CHS0354_021430 [Potamilus streckersoni]